MSIEQYTIGAAATWATPNQPLGLHPIISYWLLCSAAIVILYIRHLHSRIVSCIINMYLDPCVSINCKYKLDKIYDLIWSFNSFLGRFVLIRKIIGIHATPLWVHTNTELWPKISFHCQLLKLCFPLDFSRDQIYDINVIKMM